MNVLHVAGGLPTSERPSLQPFIKAQIDSLVKAGLNVQILDIKGYESILNYITYGKKVKQIVTEKKIDIIHAHYGYCGVTAVLAKTGLPIVLSFMGSDLLGSPDEKGNITFRGRFDRFLTKNVAKKVDRIIVKSLEMKTKVSFNIPIDVIPNGVNFNIFKPGNKKENKLKLGFNENEFIVLFLGDPKLNRKNYSLAKKGFDIFIENNKISNARIVAPFGVSQSKVIEYMNASNVLLLTSYWEGSPNVIKESMACNSPIISVNVGDVKEVIDNTFNCYLVDYSENQIAEKLKLIYDNRQPSNGREKILHLDDFIIAKRIINVYEKVLGENKKNSK